MGVNCVRVCERLGSPLHNHVPNHPVLQVLTGSVRIGFADREVRVGKKTAEITMNVTVKRR